MNADGSGQTKLTNNSAYDFLPAWSPDGRHIGYVSRDVDSVRVRTVEVRSEEPGPRGSS